MNTPTGGEARMVVHLIDPADIHADPDAYDGVPFAEPRAIERAHTYWRDRGFAVERKPGDAPDSEHPRFRACPTCNAEAMREGRLRVNLPTTPPARPERGGRGRDATRP